MSQIAHLLTDKCVFSLSFRTVRVMSFVFANLRTNSREKTEQQLKLATDDVKQLQERNVKVDGELQSRANQLRRANEALDALQQKHDRLERDAAQYRNRVSPAKTAPVFL